MTITSPIRWDASCFIIARKTRTNWRVRNRREEKKKKNKEAAMNLIEKNEFKGLWIGFDLSFILQWIFQGEFREKNNTIPATSNHNNNNDNNIGLVLLRWTVDFQRRNVKRKIFANDTEKFALSIETYSNWIGNEHFQRADFRRL